MQCILGVLLSYNSLLYRGRQEIDDCGGSDKLVASNTRCLHSHELNATYKLIIDSLFHIMTVLLAIVILAFIIHNYYTHGHPTGPLWYFLLYQYYSNIYFNIGHEFTWVYNNDLTHTHVFYSRLIHNYYYCDACLQCLQHYGVIHSCFVDRCIFLLL